MLRTFAWQVPLRSVTYEGALDYMLGEAKVLHVPHYKGTSPREENED